MPRVPPERLAATRAQILDGARRAFAEHGYERATVRVLEAETGLSRGAIFHHFKDKDALFLALAEQDAAAMATVVAEGGLVEVMRRLPERDAGWLGVQLEVSRRLRTDAGFRAAWSAHRETVRRGASERLARGQAAGTVRADLPADTLATFLLLALDGLTLHLATGSDERTGDVGRVLALIEQSVRPGPAAIGAADQDVGNDSASDPDPRTLPEPRPHAASPRRNASTPRRIHR